MEELAAPLLERYGLRLEPVDVDADPELRARYGEVVPVLLRDGRPVAKVRVSAEQLLRIVHRRR